MATRTSRRPARTRRRRSVWKTVLLWLFIAVAGFYGLIALCLVGLRWIPPFTTAVQAERRVASWRHPGNYHKQYEFVPLSRISPELQHAMIAAEDTRFYQHHGFDWKQIHIAVEEDLDGGHSRGASTITQQLVKNLFLSTGRSFIRKGIEFSIVPMTEAILSKQRILELYLNVIEWGPGIYGCEAASRRYFNIPAATLSRAQSVQLAEVIPAPLRRKPGKSPAYGAQIALRMNQMGW